MKGAKDYLKIMSYVGTAKKQKLNPFEAIRQAVLGNPGVIFAQGA
jgi:transposase